MWHSDAVGGVVIMRLSVRGCFVRGVGVMMIAVGREVILSWSGCVRYAYPLREAVKDASMMRVMMRVIFFLGFNIFRERVAMRMNQSERLRVM